MPFRTALNMAANGEDCEPALAIGTCARMNRWSKNGVPGQVCEHLQREQIVRIKREVASMDSDIIKVRPGRTGASYERPSIPGPLPSRLDYQRSHGRPAGFIVSTSHRQSVGCKSVNTI